MGYQWHHQSQRTGVERKAAATLTQRGSGNPATRPLDHPGPAPIPQFRVGFGHGRIDAQRIERPSQGSELDVSGPQRVRPAGGRILNAHVSVAPLREPLDGNGFSSGVVSDGNSSPGMHRSPAPFVSRSSEVISARTGGIGSRLTISRSLGSNAALRRQENDCAPRRRQ